jgi:putative transposase
MSYAVRREMVEKDHPQISIVRQCKLLNLNRSTLYYTPSEESKENMELMDLLDKQYQSTPFYGEKRLLAKLREKGYKINLKRLRRLMKKVCWQTLYPPVQTTRPDKNQYKYPYLLRDLNIDHRNQVWAIDITYIQMERGYMYLFAIIDVFSRYIVGWSLSNTMTARWCTECIREAIETYGKPEIINSDQGSQFTSEVYVSMLGEYGDILISMDGRGRATDNIFIERFWRSVKQEYVYLHVYGDGVELWKGLNEYIRFYNHERLHQSLDYKTPLSIYNSSGQAVA